MPFKDIQELKCKYIFITGGVCSSLGKGIAAASLGCLLQNRNLKISILKIDPYINIDPGTMSPYQHGEVYVTDDGTEADLDLGNYERFTSTKTSRLNSVTTGQIYLSVIEKERKGGFLGQTVQVIPHVTNEIKSRIYKIAKVSKCDVLIVEIGGTVGDIEGIPFHEAIRQIPLDVGRENVLYIHVTLVPFISSAGEAKTKPTQHSVKELRELGIQPDILLCRTSKNLSKNMKEKLALFCNVNAEAVIQALDVKSTIYEVPIQYSKEGLDDVVVKKLKLNTSELNLQNWQEMVNRLTSAKDSITIAVIGKYMELQDAYKSLYEAITHGAISNQVKVIIKKISASEVNEEYCRENFKDVDGIIIPGGFGDRAIDGKINACEYARNNNIPLFGICLGLQCMVIEYARNVCGLDDANSSEFSETTAYPVISLMEEQKNLMNLGGTMRLGASDTLIIKDSLAHKIYNKDVISERHRHRYEVNSEYVDILKEKGLKFSGLAKDLGLVEVIELPKNRWYFGVQFHPEFNSNPVNGHPIFNSFIEASYDYFKDRAI